MSVTGDVFIRVCTYFIILLYVLFVSSSEGIQDSIPVRLLLVVLLVGDIWSSGALQISSLFLLDTPSLI